MNTPKNERRYPGNPNDPEHRKWVGRDWDLLGAHQFNVLTSLGLRDSHYLLDIGCGSLRGGRFLMSYLLPGHYFAIEPEKWAVESGIKDEVGQNFIDLKSPSFDYNNSGNLSIFDKKFDYIIAHSVFIHSDKNFIENCIKEAKKVLKPDGIFAANFFFSNLDSKEAGWNYPDSRRYQKDTIRKIVRDVGLKMEILPWKHPHGPAHTWVVITHPNSVAITKKYFNTDLKYNYNLFTAIACEVRSVIKNYLSIFFKKIGKNK